MQANRYLTQFGYYKIIKRIVHLRLELSKDTTNRDVSQAKPRPMGGDSLVRAVVVE